jgi:hypothetical protein
MYDAPLAVKSINGLISAMSFSLRGEPVDNETCDEASQCGEQHDEVRIELTQGKVKYVMLPTRFNRLYTHHMHNGIFFDKVQQSLKEYSSQAADDPYYRSQDQPSARKPEIKFLA